MQALEKHKAKPIVYDNMYINYKTIYYNNERTLISKLTTDALERSYSLCECIKFKFYTVGATVTIKREEIPRCQKTLSIR